MRPQSPLQQARLSFHPKLPKQMEILNDLQVVPSDTSTSPDPSISSLFPHLKDLHTLKIQKAATKPHSSLRVGVVLSGGQAPGGHNVIAGLFDGLKKLNPNSRLFGFLNGPKGIVDNKTVEIDVNLIDQYRNQGGFDIIGSGRSKIETPEQFQAAVMTMHSLDLQGLVIIGGDDSNTNAALLAEYFKANECKTTVVGVPKTIDGDLKNQDVEISFGFDTASKTYSDTIGNIMRDALSAKKYYYFIKLMGRSASNITLECALQTHPNIALIAEEVALEKKTLKDLVNQICNVICERAKQKKDYGVILIPEGVIEFIPEFKCLISELNTLLAHENPHSAHLDSLSSNEEKIAYISSLLSPNSKNCFLIIPSEIQAQLLLGRDPHGNVQVSKIETERLFIEMVKNELKNRKKSGSYSGDFSPQPLFLGYEGRSCLPSNFDCQYCYSLGHVAALLIDSKASGYMCCIKNLARPIDQWNPLGIPLISMMTIETRHGKPKPVIKKALVDLDGKPFSQFKQERKSWEVNDDYIGPGPIQFFGPQEITESTSITLNLEQA